jgi:hypothetical protein
MKAGDRIRLSAKGPHDVIPAGTLGTLLRIAPPKPCNGYWLVQFDGVDGLCAFDEPYLELVNEPPLAP